MPTPHLIIGQLLLVLRLLHLRSPLSPRSEHMKVVGPEKLHPGIFADFAKRVHRLSSAEDEGLAEPRPAGSLTAAGTAGSGRGVSFWI